MAWNTSAGMEFEPIARMRTDFGEKFGIPRQSAYAEECIGRVVFEPKYRNPDALRGIEGFSHLWIIFDFSESHRDGWEPMVRPPVLGGNEKVGVFASRSPFRPNPIGLSSVRLIGVERTDEGDVLVVDGVDMMDGTPVLDIKPYIRGSDCRPDAVSGFADTAKWRSLRVEDPEGLLDILPDEKRRPLIRCLGMDPRPSYQDDGRRYGMLFAGYDVSFTVEDGVLTIRDVRKKL